MGRKRKLDKVKEWQELFAKEAEVGIKFHTRFWEARDKSGLTMADVAEILGVSIMSVYKWENGDKSPRLCHLIPLARIYGVTTDYLLGL